MDLAFRFQINMALQDIGHMARVEKFSDITLPLLWFEIVSVVNTNIRLITKKKKKIETLFAIFFLKRA